MIMLCSFQSCERWGRLRIQEMQMVKMEIYKQGRKYVMSDLSYSYDLKYDPEAQRMLERRRRQELAEAEAAAAQSVQSAAPPIPPANPSQVQEASPVAKPAVPSASPAPKRRKRGRPAKGDSPDVQMRNFPRELWNAAKVALPFPELDSQSDFLIAFVLFQLDPNVKFPTYQPPEHIAQAVKRMREALSGSDIQALGATMGQIRNKMNKFDDEMLQQRMLLAYALTVISGLHAPGKVSTGKDLKLSHENVISTAISALETFPEFKQVIRGYEGRPRRGVPQKDCLD